MPRLLERRWYSPRVFEIFLERDTWEFHSGDSTLIVLPDRVTARPYSLSSSPEGPHLGFLIRLLPGGYVSSYLASCELGTELGTTPPIPQLDLGRPGDMIWIATGTGISPFLSALRYRPDQPPLALYYGVRYREDAVEVEYLKGVCNLHLFVSGETAPGWHSGRITPERIPVDPNARYAVCGHGSLARKLTDYLKRHGVRDSNIAAEVFFAS